MVKDAVEAWSSNLLHKTVYEARTDSLLSSPSFATAAQNILAGPKRSRYAWSL